MAAYEEALDAFRSGDNQRARELSRTFLVEARTESHYAEGAGLRADQILDEEARRESL